MSVSQSSYYWSVNIVLSELCEQPYPHSAEQALFKTGFNKLGASSSPECAIKPTVRSNEGSSA